jgi:hypothetical protein
MRYLIIFLLFLSSCSTVETTTENVCANIIGKHRQEIEGDSVLLIVFSNNNYRIVDKKSFEKFETGEPVCWVRKTKIKNGRLRSQK